jgi:hypothetical protein
MKLDVFAARAAHAPHALLLSHEDSVACLRPVREGGWTVWFDAAGAEVLRAPHPGRLPPCPPDA